MGIDTNDDDEEISFPNYGPPGIGSTPQEIFASNLFNPRAGAGSLPGSRMSPFGGRDQGPRITPKPKPKATPTNVNRPGGDNRFDGASTREQYSANPTAYSGSF
jgi:ribosomal protein S30